MDSAEDFVERYRDLVLALLDSPVVAGFCYTQLTDTAQERNGLVTEDREPKADTALIAEITRGPAASAPGATQEEIQIVHAVRQGTPLP